MTIKELEEYLGVNRAHIRFYEVAGFYTPERDNKKNVIYSIEDRAIIKKVIIFRKLGITLEDIKGMFDGSVSLQEVIRMRIEMIKDTLEELNGVMDVCTYIKQEQVELDSFDESYYWSVIKGKEKQGQNFEDITDDSLALTMIGGMLSSSIFPGSTRFKKIFGLRKAIGIIIFVGSLLRGLSNMFLRKGSFLEGFINAILPYVLVAVLMLLIILIGKKNPKRMADFVSIILIVSFTFLAGILLFALGCVLYYIFRINT